MYSTDIKNKVVAEYFRNNLSVEQISNKYNICLRTVYNWTHSERNKRKEKDKTYNLRFTKKELETLQCSLFDYKHNENYPDLTHIANTLRNRILNKLECITELENAK